MFECGLTGANFLMAEIRTFINIMAHRFLNLFHKGFYETRSPDQHPLIRNNSRYGTTMSGKSLIRYDSTMSSKNQIQYGSTNGSKNQIAGTEKSRKNLIRYCSTMNSENQIQYGTTKNSKNQIQYSSTNSSENQIQYGSTNSSKNQINYGSMKSGQKPEHSFLLILFILLVCSAYGQGVHRHTIFADASTTGPVYTVNYDHIFYSGELVSYSYRIGFHWLHDEVGIPLGISLITGQQDHHAEFSLTLTPYIDRANYLFREGNISDKYLYITPGIGYRYQKPTGGLFLKALVAPLVLLDPPSDDFWNMDPKVYGLISIGAGYTF
jgi:hypothetical protein